MRHRLFLPLAVAMGCAQATTPTAAPQPQAAPVEPVAPRAPLPAAAGTLLDRMQALVAGVEKFAWETITEWDSGETGMDRGFKAQGRMRPGEGVRIKITAMGSAHGEGHGAGPGPNLHQVIVTPEHVSLSLSVLSFESGTNTQCAPHLLLRAPRGSPDHGAVDPRLLPGPDPSIFIHDEPLVAFQLAPALMFGHEPDLVVDETPVAFAGRRCTVIRSRRAADDAALGGAPGWYEAREVRKRFYVDPETALLWGMETTIESASGRASLRATVVRHEKIGGVTLPTEVAIDEERPDLRRTGRHRVQLYPCDT